MSKSMTSSAIKVTPIKASPVRDQNRSLFKRGRGLARLTTDEYNEQRDLIEMEKPLAVIRRQSVLNIPLMNSD